MIPGDVVFELEQTKHKIFERRGDNLFMKMKLTLKEALLGFKKEIPHLDGRTIELETDKMTGPGMRYRIKEEGMWNRQDAKFGDMVVEMEIVFPKDRTVPPKLREALTKHLGHQEL